jgi:hypothetical protein
MWALTVLFVAVNMGVLAAYQPRVANDSHRFLNYAAQLQYGFFLDDHNGKYLGYVLFLFVVKLFSDSLWVIAALQTLASFGALWAVYFASLRLFHHRDLGFISAAAFVLFLEIPFWNAYILCESLLISITAIGIYFLIAFLQDKKRHQALGLVFFMPWAIIIKPTGVALLAALAMWGTYQGLKNRQLIWQIVGGLTLAVCLVGAANFALASFIVVENYALGEVVYGVSTLGQAYPTLRVPVPEAITLPESNATPLGKILGFAWQNPMFFTELTGRKILLLLTHVRPYWSWTHNVFVVLFLAPMYLGTVKSLWGKGLGRLRGFFLAFLVFHILAIGLTSVDWDGRFLMPLLPAIFVLGPYGWLQWGGKIGWMKWGAMEGIGK